MFSVLETTGKDLSWIPRDTYTLADTPELAVSCLETALNYNSPLCGFDIESTGLSIFVDKIVGMSFAYEVGHAFYIPIRHRNSRNVALDDFRDQLVRLLAQKELVSHNGEYDWLRVLLELGIDYNLRHCTMIQAWLLDSDRGPRNNRKKLGLKYLAKEKLGLDMLDIEEVLPEGTYNFSYADTEDAVWYACPDSDCGLRLHKQQYAHMEQLKLLNVYRIEMEQAKAPAEMFGNGIRADQEFLRTADLNAELAHIEEEIARQTGAVINLSAPAQVADLLFNQLKLPRINGDGVDDKVLEKIEERHQVVGLVRNHREISKLQSTFVDKLHEAVAEDGRIHPEYCGTGTRSGRYSSHGGQGRRGKQLKMNAQTWPDGARVNIRKALTPAEDSIWISMDYSQIEYKVLAFTSGEEALIEGFRNGIDSHVSAAALFFGVPVELVDDEQRKQGKTLNFGVVYGMSDAGLANRLGCTVDQARRKKEIYFEKLSRVRKLIDDKKAYVLKNRNIRTVFGRIRWYRDILELEPKHRDRLLGSAFNTFIQGTAADLNKIGLGRVYKTSKKLPVKLLSTVHDECNLEAKLSSSPRLVLPQLYKAMTIPAGIQPNWLEITVSLEIGTSYGELLEVPFELIDQYDSWEFLLNDLRERAEKAKQRKKERKAAEQTTAAADALRVTKAVRSTPSVRIHVDPEKQDEQLRALRQLCATNHGMFRLYIVADDDAEFLANRVRVNPTRAFVKAVEEAGMKIDVFSTACTEFDPSVLSF